MLNNVCGVILGCECQLNHCSLASTLSSYQQNVLLNGVEVSNLYSLLRLGIELITFANHLRSLGNLLSSVLHEVSHLLGIGCCVAEVDRCVGYLYDFSLEVYLCLCCSLNVECVRASELCYVLRCCNNHILSLGLKTLGLNLCFTIFKLNSYTLSHDCGQCGSICAILKHHVACLSGVCCCESECHVVDILLTLLKSNGRLLLISWSGLVGVATHKAQAKGCHAK